MLSSGQVAIISGGLGDIGRAIALELARRGADIALGDILPVRAAARLLAEIKRLGRRARYDRVDVSNAKAVARWVEAAEASFGTPNLIIPSAAIITAARIQELTPAQWRHELAVNLDGAFHLAQLAGQRLLRRRKTGRIVFVGSWTGHAPHIHIPAYCVGKAGLRMLCKCMALELAPRGILVNEVAPGYVNGGLSGKLFRRNPALRARAIRSVPINKLIEPEEVALQVAHLCDPRNRHMTGSVLLMDGGLSLVPAG